MSNTQKVENAHQDEQMQVEGSSSITSRSEVDADLGNQKQPIQQSKVKQYTNQNQIAVEGVYQPSEYANLPVSAELKEMFKSIQRYTPIMMDLQTKLKAFVPDFIPAIGEVDAFLKMPRPDGQPETLGLYTIDQPALNQSDKAKIDLMMANNNKKYRGAKYNKIHSIQNAQKNPKSIEQWINSVADIHKNKQAPSVSYSKGMPDIDSLMQVWPTEVEQVLSDIAVPSEEIDLSLEDYSQVACNIVDIPVHQEGDKSLIEALHVLFTLYSDFNSNEHFNQESQVYDR